MPSRCRRSDVARGVAVAAVMVVVACADADRAPRRVVLHAGASMRVAADSMASAGVVRFPRLFRVYARWAGRDRAIKPGTYMLVPGTAWGELIDDLVRGRGIVFTVTIPEGYALSQSIPLMARELHVPAESLEAAVRDDGLRRRLDIPTPTVEGYLFPDTYTYPDGTAASSIVGDMVRAFEKRWKPEWTTRAAVLGLTRHDIVTLAAIIEKEAKRDEERAVISAVYHNRLKQGMLLQADPTVQYALGSHRARVLYRDLRVKSPYNTYRVKGLPPGPIASPRLASIDAALFPADVPYLYFVARPDGRHEFRTTFKDHSAAVSAQRRARAARAAKARAARKPGS